QAEDGIRDFHVTGVQTCALPIYRRTERKTDDGPGGSENGSHFGTDFLYPGAGHFHLRLNLSEARGKLGCVGANRRDQVRNSHLFTPSRKVFSAVRVPLFALRALRSSLVSGTSCRAVSRRIPAA